MAGVQLLTAQGQALETGQHLPEEARFREALVERQPHGPHADPDPHADLEQLLFFSLFQWILPNYSMNSSGRCSNWFTSAGEN